MIPSGFPTITGAVSSVSLSGSITTDISVTDIIDITDEIAQIYGVDNNDFETTVSYITSGSLNITVSDDVNEDDVIESLQDAISSVLEVHPSDVIVSIDDEGIATFSVSGSTFAEVSALQSIVEQEGFADFVSNHLEEHRSEVSVESSTSVDDIEVVVSATIDTTDATGTRDVDSAITELIREYDLTESVIESNNTDFSKYGTYEN